MSQTPAIPLDPEFMEELERRLLEHERLRGLPAIEAPPIVPTAQAPLNLPDVDPGPAETPLQVPPQTPTVPGGGVVDVLARAPSVRPARALSGQTAFETPAPVRPPEAPIRALGAATATATPELDLPRPVPSARDIAGLRDIDVPTPDLDIGFEFRPGELPGDAINRLIQEAGISPMRARNIVAAENFRRLEAGEPEVPPRDVDLDTTPFARERAREEEFAERIEQERQTPGSLLSTLQSRRRVGESDQAFRSRLEDSGFTGEQIDAFMDEQSFIAPRPRRGETVGSFARRVLEGVIDPEEDPSFPGQLSGERALEVINSELGTDFGSISEAVESETVLGRRSGREIQGAVARRVTSSLRARGIRGVDQADLRIGVRIAGRDLGWRDDESFDEFVNRFANESGLDPVRAERVLIDRMSRIAFARELRLGAGERDEGPFTLPREIEEGRRRRRETPEEFAQRIRRASPLRATGLEPRVRPTLAAPAGQRMQGEQARRSALRSMMNIPQAPEGFVFTPSSIAAANRSFQTARALFENDSFVDNDEFLAAARVVERGLNQLQTMPDPEIPIDQFLQRHGANVPGIGMVVRDPRTGRIQVLNRESAAGQTVGGVPARDAERMHREAIREVEGEMLGFATEEEMAQAIRERLDEKMRNFRNTQIQSDIQGALPGQQQGMLPAARPEVRPSGETVRTEIPGVQAFQFTGPGGGRFHIVDPMRAGQVRTEDPNELLTVLSPEGRAFPARQRNRIWYPAPRNLQEFEQLEQMGVPMLDQHNRIRLPRAGGG